MRWTWAVIPLAIAATGCGESRSPRASLPVAYAGGRPALQDSPAIAFLRNDTPFALVARSPRALDRALGWESLATLVGDDQRLFADLSTWKRAGIDLERPFGFATLDLETHTVALFATVSDRALLVAALRAAATRRGTALEETEAGSATIYLPAGDSAHAIVLRGDQAFLLSSAGARSVRDLTAVRIATTDPSDSLAEDLSFQHAVGRLQFGRDVAGFAALDRVALALVAEGDEAAEKITLAAEALRSRVAEARRSHASDDQIAALQQQAEWATMLQRARASRERLLLEVVGALGAVAFGVQLETGAARAKLVAAPNASSLPGALLRPGAEPTSMLASVSRHPLLAVAMRASRGPLLELIDLWLGTRGLEAARLAALAGLDLERDLAPLLSGEIGVAITGPSDGDLATMREQLEVALALGLVDRSRMAKLLSEIAARPDLDAAVDRSQQSPRLSFPWPGFKPLHLGLDSESLVATTDAARFEPATQRAERRSFVHDLQSSPMRELLSVPRAPAVMVVGGTLLTSVLGPEEPADLPRIAIAENESGPESPEYAALVERIARLDAEIATRQRDARAARLERSVALGRHLGTFALWVRAEPDGVVGFGGQFPSEGSLRESFADFAREKRRADELDVDAKRAVRDLEQRRNTLEKERSRIRNGGGSSLGDAVGRPSPTRPPETAHE